MESNKNFETYLSVDNKKFIFCVIQKDNFEILYIKEKIIDNNLNEINFEKLFNFIEENIFSIEKFLNDFVKDINIILESDKFLSLEISTKKNNNGNSITLNKLSHPLKDLRDQCKQTLQEKKIVHMLITNYNIDNINYLSFPGNMNCENFSLDVKFICLSNDLIDNLKKTFSNYQISIKKILSAEYLRSFQNQTNDSNLFELALKISSGYNKNEVFLVNKPQKNSGFFEKFFDFFS